MVVLFELLELLLVLLVVLLSLLELLLVLLVLLVVFNPDEPPVPMGRVEFPRVSFPEVLELVELVELVEFIIPVVMTPLVETVTLYWERIDETSAWKLAVIQAMIASTWSGTFKTITLSLDPLVKLVVMLLEETEMVVS